MRQHQGGSPKFVSKRKTSNESPLTESPKGRGSRKNARKGHGAVFKGHLKWRLLALLLLLLFLGFVFYGAWASLYDLSKLGVMPQRTAVFDCFGKPYSRLSGEDRIRVSIDKVSANFINALLAREDSRFYKHCGVDPIVRNILHMHAKEGASTLTQQLARNSFPLGGHSLHRKILEAFVAVRIERYVSKQKILESYVNRIYFGSGYYGVETASQAYFGRPASKLTLSQGALLAGLIRSPGRFSPFNDLERSTQQRDTVLERMEKLEMITPAQAAAAKGEEVVVATVRPPGAEQSYAMDLVEQTLGMVVDEDQLATGGMRIYTSIDPELQRAAESALDEELSKMEQRPGYSHPKRAGYTRAAGVSETPYLQGAVIVLDNATGGIRAIVGGRNYAESTYNRAVVSARPVGSTFKPFVYAAAFASKAVSPSTGISDGPIHRGELRCSSKWHPENSDGTFRGVLPAEEGLILSRNTMSVRIGDRVGVEPVRKLAESAGLGSLPKMPAIFLGSFSATLKDMTSAYTVFPNAGVRRQPFLIDRVDDASGRTVYRAAHIETRVLDSGVCWSISTALEKVLQRGTAASADFHKPAAGKTGTTNDYRDAWFIGYTRPLTCGVWVGLDKPAQIMSRGYGATLALPVWCDVMNIASAGRYPALALQPGKTRVAANHGSEKQGSGIFRSFRRFFGGE